VIVGRNRRESSSKEDGKDAEESFNPWRSRQGGGGLSPNAIDLGQSPPSSSSLSLPSSQAFVNRYRVASPPTESFLLSTTLF
jgi:hypothetical protein